MATGKKKSTQSKADFVRSLHGLKPQEILKRAKAAGIPLTIGYVYNVRGSANAKAKKSRGTKPAAKRTPARPTSKPTGLKQAIEQLVRRCADEILDQVRTASLREILEK